MRPEQIWGTYRNIDLRLSTSTACPPGIIIKQVEIATDPRYPVVFLVPHSFIELDLGSGAVQTCQITKIDDPLINNKSATRFLRDSDIVNLDRNNPLIDAFALENQRFFLASEVGKRVCGARTLPAGTQSMWMAPTVDISVAVSANSSLKMNFRPGFKYVYYFSTTSPCLFKGDAREQGVIRRVTPSPSPTRTPIPTPSSSRTPTPSPASGGGGGGEGEGEGGSETGAPDPSASGEGGLVPPITPPPNAIGASATPSPQKVLPGSDATGSESGDGPEDNGGEGGACFPAVAIVHLSDGQTASMEKLRVGHQVLVNKQRNEYSHVFAFSHSSRSIMSEFVRLRTTRNHTLILSPYHFVYANNKPVLAKAVAISDMLHHASGDAAVVSTDRVRMRGLYNPQTLHGDIVVNGFRATTFTMHGGGVITAHAALSPVRMLGMWLWKMGDLMRCYVSWGSYVCS